LGAIKDLGRGLAVEISCLIVVYMLVTISWIKSEKILLFWMLY